MRLLPRARGTKHGMIGTGALVLLLSIGTTTGAVASAPSMATDRNSWSTEISQTALPSGKGCFTASYPKLAWKPVACVAPPDAPMLPRVPGPLPLTIGNGNSIVAQTPGGPITQATGTFVNVSGVTSVSSPINNLGLPVANAYTIQLNTNFFNATIPCMTAFNPAICQGWTQFIFANDGVSGKVYIEYWLVNFGPNPCPSGGWIADSGHCRLSTPGTPVPFNTPITDMASTANFKLVGDVSGSEIAIMTLPNPLTTYATAATSILDPTGSWAEAEFNVFGYGGGGMATFNAGSSAQPRVQINYGGNTAPICWASGYTAETNSLLFGTPAPPPVGIGPATMFLENTVGGGSMLNCDSSVSWGDTHQVTFAGTLYDFQASGDFTEVVRGNSFEVQTRKVSGAPNWPNASINKSVGVRLGNTRVAVCDGIRLVVNGINTSVAPNGSLYLPGAGTINRIGSNTYAVRDLAGNSARVTWSGIYANLEVGLGTWPTAVRGLLANPGNNPNLLEGRDGAVYTVPLSFSDLYNRYGASWRVNQFTSLVAPCNASGTGNPSAPFFAANLNPQLRAQAEATCRQAGVIQVWVDTCTLDVAVLGAEATPAFIGMVPPVVNGNLPRT
jgi:hypothetical protein